MSGLPKLRGDPCWIITNGPFNLEKRNEIRFNGKDNNPHRKFTKIIRNNGSLVMLPTFEFNTE